MREAVELVTEQGLKLALKTRVLPENMRSIPHLGAPFSRAATTTETLEPEWEERYEFRDGDATRRKGSIVWTASVVATKIVSLNRNGAGTPWLRGALRREQLPRRQGLLRCMRACARCRRWKSS